VDESFVVQLLCRFAVDVHEIVRRAAGQADMSLLGFARAIDHATDHRDVHRHQQVVQAPFQLVHGLDHIEILPRAARAGDEVDPARTQPQRLENIEADLDLFHRIGGQRDADGVADAFGQQHAQAHRGLHRARAQAAGFGDAQVQRLLDLVGQLAVGGNRHEHVGGLHADLEVWEIQAIQMLDMAQRGLDQRFRCRLAIFLLQVLLQRTGIDTDADRNTPIARRVDHRSDAIFASDVAGIDAQAIDTQFGHAQSDLVIEMNVGDQRQLYALLDLAEGFGGVHGGYGHPHDIGTGILQPLNLRNGRIDVTGFGVGHALHGNGCVAADRYAAHPDLASVAAFDGRLTVHVLLSELEASSLATGLAGKADGFAVVGDLCARGIAEAQVERR